ncbi:hypothetical protein M501DRAFT_1004364 [Patellaria atrata CBS 101060]|uniref:SPIN90/Ldb17 leucine-rich domain-containing protein n=1 Tax=Patellaria atrata CBS 101060 TaxID=1346257 RepID=A0A9P4SBI7_9PEZI|nr:hypothetical protein M501DRAFT_1004364 [Patellaria atrata CBS 101060]
MEFNVSYSLDNEQQFWDELDDIVAGQCETCELIDNALRSYLHFTTTFKEEYLKSEYDIARCSYKLLESRIFRAHKEYVRRQFIYCLLQEDDAKTLHVVSSFLLFDGREDEDLFQMMRVESAFPKLVELVKDSSREEDMGLHKLLLELLYEMSRIQRLSWEDLSTIDDAFVLYLFRIIEELSNDVNDPYHYPVIRVLLVLNEQYMVTSTLPNSTPLTNRIIKAFSTHGNAYKTFGENLILLLNRESETSLQLLILKLLYLLFQSESTAEYFYTNDLHVLLDVILRNLLDLPSGNEREDALRHTYLRVLHPLLANSQLRCEDAHYKCHEVLKCLRILRGRNSSGTTSWHFAPVDETTVRLVKRCMAVEWLQDHIPVTVTAPTTVPASAPAPPPPRRQSHINGKNGTKSEKKSGDTKTLSPTHATYNGNGHLSPDKEQGDGQKELARRMLGMGLEKAGESAISVAEVAAHMERPGVMTASRREEG